VTVSGRNGGPIRVLLADDDPLVRSGLRILLGGAEGIEVVAEVGDGSEVLGAVDRHRPDVVLMDIRMPELDGIAAAGLLAGQPSPPAVLMLTTFDTDELVLRALRAGAAGFLLKDTPPAEIVRAIELVAAGDSMLSPAITRQLIQLVAGEGEADSRRSRATELIGRLSPRKGIDVAVRALGILVENGIDASLTVAGAIFSGYEWYEQELSELVTSLGLDDRVHFFLVLKVYRSFEADGRESGVVHRQTADEIRGDDRQVIQARGHPPMMPNPVAILPGCPPLHSRQSNHRPH